MDELTSKVSRLNLEHVRHIKNRLVALSGRVQKVGSRDPVVGKFQAAAINFNHLVIFFF